MPKRKTLPKIEGVGVNIPNGVVQKSRPLLTLSSSDLTLPEFKMLDLYLARINSHKPDVRTVELERGELEKALGITKLNKKDLLNRLKGLYQPVELVCEENRIKTTVLFENADAERDEKSGLWTITLTCTKRAMEHIFNVENVGYLRYRLKCVLELSSRYSYVLFLYLLDNRFRGDEWEIPLEELKALLHCTADTYSEYKRFNDLVLKKCHKEITEKTDLKYTYKPLRKGRTVDRVKFAVERINDYVEGGKEPPAQIEGQITADTLVEPLYSNDDYKDDRYSFLAEACDCEFSEEEIAVLNELLLQLQEAGKIDDTGHKESKELARYKYLQGKHKDLKLYEQRKLSEGKPIKDRFAYFRKMLEKELG